MGLTAKELTNLIGETNKVRKALDRILDYVDLINKNSESLPEGTKESLEDVNGNVSSIGTKVDGIKNMLNIELNKIPVDPDEVKLAADNLLLYHGKTDEVMNWALTQLRGHDENSYWWKYWKGVCDAVLEKQAQEQKQQQN